MRCVDMPRHQHANPDFVDLDSSGLGLDKYHLAYRFGQVGEEPADALTPYLPLSISFGPPQLEASRQTLRYGLQRDFWRSPESPSDDDRSVLLRSALSVLAADIRSVESGDDERLRTRRFMTPY
jgi:hypothetical protein